MNAESAKKPVILLLISDKDLAESIRIYLEDAYKVYMTANQTECLDLLAAHPIDLLLVDLDMSELEKAKWLDILPSDFPRLKILGMYMFLDEDDRSEINITKIAHDYIFKPFSASVMKYKIDALLQSPVRSECSLHPL
jgi:DNA-binding response OmpR family regulator